MCLFVSTTSAYAAQSKEAPHCTKLPLPPPSSAATTQKMKDRLNAIKVRQWFRPCQGSARDQGALVDDIMEKAVGAHSQPGGPIAFIHQSQLVCLLPDRDVGQNCSQMLDPRFRWGESESHHQHCCAPAQVWFFGGNHPLKPPAFPLYDLCMTPCPNKEQNVFARPKSRRLFRGRRWDGGGRSPRR